MEEEDRLGSNDDEKATEKFELDSASIQILILAPTRELAAQIGKEADKLLATHTHRDDNAGSFHPNHPLSCQVIFGGSSKEQEGRFP